MAPKSAFDNLPYEVRDAYRRGLNTLGPDAEHDAEELGIPYGEPMAAAQYEVGREVAAVVALHSSAVEAPDKTAREEWVESLVSMPMHKFPKIPRRTPDELAASRAAANEVRNNVRPLREQPPTQQEN